MTHYAEIRTDYIDCTHFEGDADFQYVDTWQTTDNDEDGHSVAKVNLTSGEVIWTDTNRDVISNPQIILAIASIINEHKLA